MEPFEGPLKAAGELLGSANRLLGKEPPRTVFDLAHGAIHNFVEAVSKFKGIRGKIRHTEVWRRAQDLGFPVDLVKEIKVVEDQRGIVYGAVVTEEDARNALDTANRVERVVGKRMSGKRRAGRRT